MDDIRQLIDDRRCLIKASEDAVPDSMTDNPLTGKPARPAVTAEPG